MRLQDAIGNQEIIKQMVLLPEAATPAVEDKSVLGWLNRKDENFEAEYFEGRPAELRT